MGVTLKTLLLLIFLPFSWICAKETVASLGVEYASASRVVLASIVFAGIVVLNLRTRVDARASWREWKALCILSLLGFTLYFTLISFALERLHPSQAGIYLALMPAISYLGGLVVGVERHEARKTLGLILGTAGALYYGGGIDIARGGDVLVYALAAFLAALSYAAYGIVYKKLLPHTNPLSVLPLLTALGAVTLVLLFGPVDLTSTTLRLSARETALVLMLGTVFTVPIYYLYHDLVRAKGPVYANTTGLLTPFMVLLGEWMFGYRHSMSTLELAAMFVALAGVYLVLVPKDRPSTTITVATRG